MNYCISHWDGGDVIFYLYHVRLDSYIEMRKMFWSLIIVRIQVIIPYSYVLLYLQITKITDVFKMYVITSFKCTLLIGLNKHVILHCLLSRRIDLWGKIRPFNMLPVDNLQAASYRPNQIYREMVQCVSEKIKSTEHLSRLCVEYI